MTYQFQRFVIKLQICLKLFYSRTINYSFFNEEKDELINLITTLIFRTGKIYDTMFSLYRFSLRREIHDMTIKYEKLKKITPEDLGVARQFCLDKTTLEMQEEILQKALKDCENEGENEKEKENNKGAYEINLSENKMEKRKITTLIKIVEDKKRRIPKPGQRNMEDLKVNLDFDDDNSDSDKMNINRNDSVFIDNNNIIGSILPKLGENDIYASSANVSVDNITLHKGNFNINDPDEDLLTSNNIINTNENKDKNNPQNYLFGKKSGGSQDEYDSNVIVRDSNAVQKNIVPFIPEKFIGRVSYMRKNNDDFISYPYETAIQLLKQIRKYKTPFEKMMIIASISNEITDCINDFWGQMESYIKKDLLGIEAEQIVTIFIYIIIQSGIIDIFVHCKMIQFFTTCTTKSSTIGYYYSTVEASITFIRTLKNVDELFKNTGKNKIFA